MAQARQDALEQSAIFMQNFHQANKHTTKPTRGNADGAVPTADRKPSALLVAPCPPSATMTNETLPVFSLVTSTVTKD